MVEKVIFVNKSTYHQPGFSLMEILLTVAILTLGLLMSLPSLHDFLANQRMRSDHSKLTMDLLYGRSIAVNQGQRVVLCPSSDGTECLQDPYWESGWMLFVDSDNDRELSEGEHKLKISPELSALTARSSSSRQRIRFFPDGSATGSAATITLCGPRGAQFARAIVVSNSGRVRQTQASTDENQLNCP